MSRRPKCPSGLTVADKVAEAFAEGDRLVVGGVRSATIGEVAERVGIGPRYATSAWARVRNHPARRAQNV